jgi:DNA-binding NarL/FixJ family response regulator
MGEAFRAIRRLHPDIVVTEIMRPLDLGFIRELHCKNPHLLILVFTIRQEAIYRRRAEAAGASSFLEKEAGGEALLRELRAVLEAPERADSRGRVRR